VTTRTSIVFRIQRVTFFATGLLVTLGAAGGCSLLPFGHHRGGARLTRADRVMRPELHEVASNAQPDCIATEHADAAGPATPVAPPAPQCTACACATDAVAARAVSHGKLAPTAAAAAVAKPAIVCPAAEDELQRLMDGNKRFVEGESENLPTPEHDAVAARSVPRAMVVACSDWKVPPEAAFDARPGELIVVRASGNAIDDEVVNRARSVVQRYEVPLIIVLGSDAVAAAKAAIDDGGGGDVRPAGWSIRVGGGFAPYSSISSTAGIVERVAQLQRSAPAIAGRVQAGRLKIVGATYEPAHGVIMLETGDASPPSPISVEPQPQIAATPQD
jgi:carbonic anhydrase